MIKSCSEAMYRTTARSIVSIVYTGIDHDEPETDHECVAFPARLDRTSGHLILEGRSHNLLEPQISFVPISGTKATFTYPIDDIVEIKKVYPSHSFPFLSVTSQGP